MADDPWAAYRISGKSDPQSASDDPWAAFRIKPAENASKSQKEEPTKKRSLANAVTDIPGEIGSEAMGAVNDVAALKNRGEMGPVEGLLATGKAALAPIRMALSPITGTIRSVGGNLMTQGEHAVGTILAPDLAAKDNLDQMYETAKGDVDKAVSAVGSRGPIPTAAPVVAATGPRQEIAAAADRLAATGNPVDVPNAIASDSMVAQRSGQALRNMPVIGDAIPKATAKLGGQLEDAIGAMTGETPRSAC